MKNIENKKVYRCDSISSVDDFLSAREVLKLEMFGDDTNYGFRNFDGVISDIERLFPDFNLDELMESFNVEQLEHDVEIQYNFTDKLIELLQKNCGVPEELFNYAIWACDTPEEVVESYDVEPEDINCYIIEKGILLQDLGPEGQLYGVSERPECILEESLKVSKLKESVSDKKSKSFDTKYDKGELENIMENKEELFNRIYEECVCAGGASGISGMTPQHMTAVVDAKAGDVSRFTGGNGGRKVKTDKEVLFTNDTMKVHKKRTKKGDAVTGTGVVYANGKLMEAMDKILESFEQEDEPQIPLTETKRAPDGSIESNKDGSVGDWSPLDSQVFAYDLIDAGKAGLDERQILKELYDHPYFKDLFDAIEEEETKLGGSTSNTVGWDNVASDEIEHAAKEVYGILQAHKE